MVQAAFVLSSIAFSLSLSALILAAFSLHVASGNVLFKKRKPEETVEEAKEEDRRSKEIEEGFENLMRFSVRGHDGFDTGGKL